MTFALFQMKQATGFKYYNQTHTESLFYDDKQCTGPFQFYCGKWNPLWFSKELQNVAKKSGDAKWVTGINVVRMRYPQILLYYAEACYMLGGKGNSVNGGPTALAALEDVHTRAYESANKEDGKAFIDSLANENFMEALYAENAWEFAGEGIRKFDLIRWGQLSHKIVEAKKAYLDGVKLQPSEGGYPRQFFYRFKTTKLDAKCELLEADPESFCWFGTDVYPIYPGEVRATKNDAMDQKWFAHGDNGMSDTNL